MTDFDSRMEEKRVFKPSKEFSIQAHVKSLKQYNKIYERSIKDPIGFWAEKAEEIDWFKKWDNIFRYTEPPFVKWFEGGKLNVSFKPNLSYFSSISFFIAFICAIFSSSTEFILFLYN